MKRGAFRRSGKVSAAMKAAALRLAEEAGIRPLQDGERRPADFYLVNHFTGRPVVKNRNAVISKNLD